ncbi:MAG: hypothetical protein ACTMHL_06360, partial [Janibacter sp.]
MPARRIRATWAGLAALAVSLGGCTLVDGDSPSSSTSGPTSDSTADTGTTNGSPDPGQSGSTSGMSVETFDVPAKGRDWVVLVEDPKDTSRAAGDLKKQGLSLT